MAGSSRFAEGRAQVINGDVEFQPSNGGSKAHSGGIAAASSRASASTGSSSARASGSEGVSSVGDSSHDSATRDSRSEGVSSVGASSSHDSAARDPRSMESGSDAATTNWRSLFTSDVKLQYVAPVINEGMKSVHIPKSVLDKGSNLWYDCLVG